MKWMIYGRILARNLRQVHDKQKHFLKMMAASACAQGAAPWQAVIRTQTRA